MKNYFLLIGILILLFQPNPISGQPLPDREINCSDTFTELTQKVETNYIGYKKLVNAGEKSRYINLKNRYRRLLNNLTAENCTRMLRMFLHEFDDGHLFVFERPEYSKKEKRILKKRAGKNRRNINKVLEELNEQGQGKVTGKWSDGNYEIAIIKEDNIYNAYNITESDTLPSGSLLASFRKANMNGRMHGRLYNYNNEPKFIEANVFKENTLLKFYSDNMWGRIEGAPNREIKMINHNEILQPSITFLNDETTLFNIPSFSTDFVYLRTLLLSNADSVASRSKLIIDVRGNTGGNAVYFSFIPVFATQGLTGGQGEVYASDDTKAYFERMAANNPDLYLPVVQRIQKNMGEIVLGPDYPDKEFAPYPSKIEQVAILTDKACMSACESFILHSKAMSNKVKVYGTNTAGVIDYTSVMSMKLKSSGNQNVYFGFPTSSLSKNYFTNEYPNGYNKTGIRPDVLVPDTVSDKTTYVLDMMEK